MGAYNSTFGYYIVLFSTNIPLGCRNRHCNPAAVSTYLSTLPSWDWVWGIAHGDYKYVVCRTDDANEFLNGVSVAANNKALYWWTKFIGKKRSNTRAISDTVSACRMLTALHILLCPERSTAERFDMLTDNVEYVWAARPRGREGGRDDDTEKCWSVGARTFPYWTCRRGWIRWRAKNTVWEPYSQILMSKQSTDSSG